STPTPTPSPTVCGPARPVRPPGSTWTWPSSCCPTRRCAPQPTPTRCCWTSSSTPTRPPPPPRHGTAQPSSAERAPRGRSAVLTEGFTRSGQVLRGDPVAAGAQVLIDLGALAPQHRDQPLHAAYRGHRVLAPVQEGDVHPLQVGGLVAVA